MLSAFESAYGREVFISGRLAKYRMLRNFGVFYYARNVLLVLLFVVMVGCGQPLSSASPVDLPTPVAKSGTMLPAEGTSTPVNTPPALLQPTSFSEDTERPVFLAWPLPAHVGLARISQFPNSAWSWNFLGLNPGYECPPMFGYLLNVGSWPYWRDSNIPEAQDMAQADPHNFEMVACYSTDGSIGSPDGHEGTDIKALPGTPVLASADGLVMEWRLTGLNSMIVLKHCLFGQWDENHACSGGQQWYTTYMHLVPASEFLQENLPVTQGVVLGKIFDQSINSHLHFEVGRERRSYANFVNPWGEDVAPWLDCLWENQSLCLNPDPEFQRLIFYAESEIGIGAVDGAALRLTGVDGIRKVGVWGNQIGFLDASGNLFLGDKHLTAADLGNLSGWEMIAEQVLDFQIVGERIAMINSSGELLLKDLSVGDSWKLLATGVARFSLAETRVGYLTVDGGLHIEQNDADGTQLFERGQVRAFQLTENRVAFLDDDNLLWGNEGRLDAEYQPVAKNPLAFQVTNRRLGLIDADGKLLVKEGNLRAEWLELAVGVRSFQLVDMRILMLGADDIYRYKNGSLFQAWTALPYQLPVIVVLNGSLPVTP